MISIFQQECLLAQEIFSGGMSIFKDDARMFGLAGTKRCCIALAATDPITPSNMRGVSQSLSVLRLATLVRGGSTTFQGTPLGIRLG